MCIQAISMMNVQAEAGLFLLLLTPFEESGLDVNQVIRHCGVWFGEEECLGKVLVGSIHMLAKLISTIGTGDRSVNIVQCGDCHRVEDSTKPPHKMKRARFSFQFIISTLQCA